MPIHIGKPYIRQEAERTCLCALLKYNEQEEEAWFSVEQEYAAGLTWERSDAFVIGFLTTAMWKGEDIFCEAPITKRLYYQLTTYLIPTMAANMPVYHAIRIHAPVAEKQLPCAGAVATGWTGGVDSMYTLMTHIQPSQPGYRLTHLLIANNGALEGKHCRQNLDNMVSLARQGIARELGLSVIGIDSNLHILQSEHYLSVAVFRLCAVVLAVQKLLRVFLHSAGGDFSLFKLDQENSARYELLPLSCFETDNTHFYTSGGAASRMQKLEVMADFAPAQNYLHPCIYVGRTNCGTCLKCMRTMTGLYSLGTLEKFGNVFDVERFCRQKEDYFFQLLNHEDHPLHAEILRSMERRGIPIPPQALRRSRIRRAATIVAQRKLKPKED